MLSKTDFKRYLGYRAVPYFIAVLLTAIAVAARLLLWDFAGGKAPYAFFFGIVTLVGIFGGSRPALFAALLGGFAGDYFVVEPPFSFSKSPADIFALLTFFVIAALISELCGAHHRTSKLLEQELRSAHVESAERLRLAKELTSEALARTAAEERFRVAQEVSPIGFVFLKAVRSQDGKIVDFNWDYINPAAKILLPPAADIGVSIRKTYAPTVYLEEMLQRFADAVTTGKPLQTDARWVSPEFNGWLTVRAVKVGDGVAVSFADITRRKNLETDLQASLEEFKRADRQKDEFLAVLAHELRNPMAPLKNALHILRLSDGRKDIADEAQRMMERQLEQLVKLVDELLDISRITHGKIVLDKAHINLIKVLNNAIETVAPVIDAAKHTLKIQLPKTPIFVEGDFGRMTQIFGNLINNAAKYTPHGGIIELSAVPGGSTVSITVKDNGIGVSSTLLPRIFDMFTQLKEVKSNAQGGLGVGLALVRRLVELHSGTVSAHSDGIGKGSSFTVTLPVSAAQAFDASPQGEVLKPTSKRVVVVDDNHDAAETLKMILSLLGAEADVAFSGLGGFEVIDRLRPDIAILDIGMPDIDGRELARRIRAEDWGKEMRLIALSGWGQAEDRRLSKAAGFDEHLVKPVAAEELQQVLAGIPVSH